MDRIPDRIRPASRAALLIALVLGLAFLGPVCSRGPAKREALTWTLPDLSGAQVGPAGFRGKVVLVNFWATWCTFCVQEMPALDSVARARADEVVVLAVDVGESKDTVETYLRGKGYSFKVLLDSDEELAVNYGIRGLPTTLVLNRNGAIIGRFEGALAEEMFAHIIDEALKN